MEVEAFDWNCPQHITPQFAEAQVAAAMQAMTTALNQLRAGLAALRAAAGEEE